MKTINIRAFVFGPALVAAAVGLALTASGCVIDPGPGYAVNCQSDLTVNWQIQNSSGGLVTCDGAGASTVVINIDGVDYAQTCPPGQTQGWQDIPLQQNNASYNVTVHLENASGTDLATPLAITVPINQCGSYSTPTAQLVLLTP